MARLGERNVHVVIQLVESGHVELGLCHAVDQVASWFAEQSVCGALERNAGRSARQSSHVRLEHGGSARTGASLDRLAPIAFESKIEARIAIAYIGMISFELLDRLVSGEST